MTDPKPPSDPNEQQIKKWYERSWAQILLFAGGIAFFGLVLGMLTGYIDPKTSTVRYPVQALGLITAGLLAGAVGILFSWPGSWRGQRLEELRPLLMSLLFVGLGIVLLWAARFWINDPASTAMGDAVFVALLIMPILIYAIISGRLTGFTGPGGVGATFNAVATTSVSETVAQDPVLLDQQSVQRVDKGDLRTLHNKIQELDEVTPVALTLTFGGGHYSLEALQKYLEGLSRSRNFKLVVFLTKDDRFLAYMPSWAAKRVLDTANMGTEFVRVINDGDAKLFQYASVVRKSISTRSTHAEALREMIDRNIEAMVVTDETKHLKGIAEREQILSTMMLALTEKK
jgi:hypothetical protein